MAKNRPSADERYVREQLEQFDNRSSFALFRGSVHYRVLQRLEVLIPGFTVIRLKLGDGRFDQHYQVTDDFSLEGMQAEAHSGVEGIFTPEALLDGDVPSWEAHNLRRSPPAST